ncbi:hypothetical protein [Flavihumibacter fluvii]|uniref:hypothetical protein n=1 Tax=Flavihumibacter fluvii TaxID=2838157 RepID=UPI001BDE96BD|nr:hypothetical protein [Flavihumibacter fluvii]ULQ53648.1 hypothetical protein KJS93_04845 [Flavihumibacter fluvii]
MLFLSTRISSNKYAVIAGLLLSLQSYSQIQPTPAADRLKSLQKRQALATRAGIPDLPFRNIGPSVMSGRVVDIDANPADPTEFYLAYATGGLWYTQNNGQSFVPIFDSEQVIGIGDIAVNWTSSERIIWVGTGEVNSSRSSYAGIGVYKSRDNGKNWTYAGLPESHHIGKIQLDPIDPNTAWVAVLGHLYSPNKERGVYKTSDGGKNWTQTLAIDENTGVVDLDINPANPRELFAAAWHRTRTAWNFEESGNTSGIYRSQDGGEHWSLVSGPSSGFINGPGVGRIGIAVSPKDPQVIYAVVDNQIPLPDTGKKISDTMYQLSELKGLSKMDFDALDDKKLANFLKVNYVPEQYSVASLKDMVRKETIKPTALYDYLFVDDGFQNKSVTGCEVYRSDDGGKQWNKTNTKPINIFSTYGYYFSKIYVSPINTEKIFILGYSAQLSADGGKTFSTIDKGNVHADHHALWINPKKDSHIINGNDGGCNISYDNGANWFKANTPAVAQYYAIAVDSTMPYRIYGGLQDNGSWYGPSTNEESPDWIDSGEYGFKRLNGGDGMQVQVDARDNSTVYSGSQFGYYYRFNLLQKTDVPIRPRHVMGEYPLRFNWQTPILLSSHNSDVLYIGSNRFHRSLAKGDRLQTLSNDLSNGARPGDVPFGTITTISESPLHFGLLYIGTDDGNIQLSRDGGYSWNNLGKPAKKNAGLPQGLFVSRVLASTWKEGRVYVTLNGYRNDHFNAYVFVSEDFGSNWRQIGNDLPMEPVNVIREDPKSERIIYVGTDGGLYASIDGGQGFMTLNKGLPASVPVHDIAIQKRANEIVLGTHGRSLYIGKLDALQAMVLPKPADVIKSE